MSDGSTPLLPDLTDDCSRCAALCCVAYPFDTGDEFAIDKPVDAPCSNLDCGHRCSIHSDLLKKGFPGCVAYSCAGAGQRVTQDLFDGQSWRDDPNLLPHMTYALRVLRPIHEALTLLEEATRLPLPASVQRQGAALAAALCPTGTNKISDFEDIDVQDALADVPIYLQSLATFV